MYSSVVLSAFTLLCNHQDHPSPESLPFPQLNSGLININSQFPPTPSPWQLPFYCFHDFDSFRYLILGTSTLGLF